MDAEDWAYTIAMALAGAIVMGAVVLSLFAFIGPVPEVPPCTP